MPLLKLVHSGEQMDHESLLVFQAFCIDPLSQRTGELIESLLERRRPRGQLHAIDRGCDGRAAHACADVGCPDTD